MEKKFKQSEQSEEKKVGQEQVNKKYEQSSEKKLKLLFKGNRTFELRLGRETHRFEGRTSKFFNKKILDHPDFTPAIKKYFSIQEV